MVDEGIHCPMCGCYINLEWKLKIEANNREARRKLAKPIVDRILEELEEEKKK